MRWPCRRFTVRGLMIAVAVIAVGFGASLWVVEMGRRSHEYRRRAADYEDIAHPPGSHSRIRNAFGQLADGFNDENSLRRRTWALHLAAKYRRLAIYPWGEVEPDSPPPERLAWPRSAFDIFIEVDETAAVRRARPPAWTVLWTWDWEEW